MVMLGVVLAAADCEALHDGWPGQPINSWSSLGFVVVGAMLLARGRHALARLAGAAVVGVGVGSVLFHGHFDAFSGWVHDWSIATLLVVLLAREGSEPNRLKVAVAVAAALAVAFAVVPASGEVVGGALAVGIVIVEVTRFSARRRRPMISAIVLLSVGALLAVVGRTDGLLCAPQEVWQPHAAWHLLAAAGLLSYAAARGWLGRPVIDTHPPTGS